MTAILLTIAYDGTNYAGWQVQENALTIQECMMRAGAKFLPEGFTITTASRTDAGVHAIGQRAVLKADTKIPTAKICDAFNSYLPEEIRVWQAEEVPQDFHPRYHAKKKLYVYRIWNSRIAIPAYRSDHVLFRRPCDPEKMQAIAERFVGEHDFNAFSCARKTVKDTVRQIYRCEVRERKDSHVDPSIGRAFEIYVEGNGFLYHMVRILAGCIVEWGSREEMMPEEIDHRIKEAFRTGDRNLAAQTMPASGLCLLKIEY